MKASKEMSKIAILGFGKEGMALYKYFKTQNCMIDIYDEKIIDIPIDFTGRIFVGFEMQHKYDKIFKSPGISVHKIKSTYQKIEKFDSLINLLFSKLDTKQVIGVTGTKGKSTVSSLIHHILVTNNKKSELLGNIGNINPQLFDHFDKDCFYVFELSSFQTEFLQYSPHIAVFTSFFVDHQDVHANMSEYLNAKLNLVLHQKKEDFCIMSEQFEQVLQNNKINLQTNLKVKSDIEIIDNNFNYLQTTLLGNHNQINCQLAMSTCLKLGLTKEEIIKSIKSYQPLAGRLEMIGEHNGIKFYADDLATIPEATWSGIQSLERQNLTTLITGGYDKGLDYELLAKNLVNTKIQNYIYFEPTGNMITKYLDKKQVNLIKVNNMQEAVEKAFEITKSGQTCLLSCASASFGLFKNAYDRGEQYRFWVKEIASIHSSKQID